MWRFLVALGGFTLVIGLLTIVFGSVIFVSTIGNALIGTGAIGFTGGALIIAVAFVLREVEQLRLLVQAGGASIARAEPSAMSDVSDAAMLAVSQAVAPGPFFTELPPVAAEPAPPEPAREPAVPPAPAPTPVDVPAPRPRSLSFGDRLRAQGTVLATSPVPPPAPSAPRVEDDVPVVERRGRILPRAGEGEASPPVPRPRSLLDRMSLGRPAAERPAPPPAPERSTPDLPAAEPPAPEPYTPEPAPVEASAPAYSEPEQPAQRPYGAPPPRLAPEPTVLKSGIVGGMAYTLYSDGSIQAELPDGVVRFASLMELREHVSRANPPA